MGQLIELYAYSQAIVETIREPLVVLDKELRVKSANKAFYEKFHVNREDTEGKHIYELGNSQWDIPELRLLLEKILKKNFFVNDYKVTHDFPLIGKKTMALNARRVILEGHKTHLILLAIEDITYQQEIQKIKDDFISLVSHELKTPLASIKAYIQVLEKKLSETGDRQLAAYLSNVDRQSNKLNELLNELLDAGELEFGRFNIKKETFSLPDLIERVKSDFETTYTSHTLIQRGRPDVQIQGDKNRVEQVLTNLLSNAVKYSPDSGKVVLNVVREKDSVTFCVKDYGVGIAKSDLSKVFERYYRSPGVSHDAKKSFGLGLYIAAEIVKEHDGEIWVKSTPGKGSSFYFSLPVRQSRQ